MPMSSQIIQEAFENNVSVSTFCLEIAKQTMLSVDDVKQWIDHLYTFRKNCIRGAAKAAETRQSKKNNCGECIIVCYCGVLQLLIEEFTVTVEQWIGCDKCDAWLSCCLCRN